jgi:hypothetical protein
VSKFWFHRRAPVGNAPEGITVSKTQDLPAGDFAITEYCWGDTCLWFVDDDKFSADERQEAFDDFVLHLRG